MSSRFPRCLGLAIVSIASAAFLFGCDSSSNAASGPAPSDTTTVRHDTVVRGDPKVRSDYGVAWNSSIAFDSVKDARDGMVYRTVKIGSQTWMAENLNFATGGGWCDGGVDSCGKYGRRYSWSVAMAIAAQFDTVKWSGDERKHQGICPAGWHLPTSDEWLQLVAAVEADPNVGSGLAGTALKAPSGWTSGGNGVDRFGFRALPSGSCSSATACDNLGISAMWWSSLESGPAGAWYELALAAKPSMKRTYEVKQDHYAIRCVLN